MNTESQLESAKDDDFDFFKKPKNTPVQSELTKAVLEKEDGRLAAKSKQQKIILFLGIFVPMVLFIVLSEMNKPQPVHLVPKEEVMQQVPTEPALVEAPTTNNKEESFNVDYSKLSKEDAENVKQALDQFKDIQKTLIETSKPATKP